MAASYSNIHVSLQQQCQTKPIVYSIRSSSKTAYYISSLIALIVPFPTNSVASRVVVTINRLESLC
jgi:hypothetical protein